MSIMDLNLLPSQAKFQASKIKWQKKIRLVMVVLATGWLMSITVVFGLNLVAQLRIQSMTEQYNKVQAEYVKMADNIVLSQQLKYKAKMVGGVLNERFEYSKTFELVKGLFPESVQINKFDLKDKKNVKLECVTAGQENVDLMEKTIEAINNGKYDKLASASLNGLALKAGVWHFQLEVNLK